MADIRRKKGKLNQKANMPPSADKKKEPVLKRNELIKTKIITIHTIESDDQTLSHIALKYYNHCTPPYWKYILENNMEVLRGSEKNAQQGMKLVIYELPDELKD